jgi:hypothetical protein
MSLEELRRGTADVDMPRLSDLSLLCCALVVLLQPHTYDPVLINELIARARRDLVRSPEHPTTHEA